MCDDEFQAHCTRTRAALRAQALEAANAAHEAFRACLAEASARLADELAACKPDVLWDDEIEHVRDGGVLVCPDDAATQGLETRGARMQLHYRFEVRGYKYRKVGERFIVDPTCDSFRDALPLPRILDRDERDEPWSSLAGRAVAVHFAPDKWRALVARALPRASPDPTKVCCSSAFDDGSAVFGDDSVDIGVVLLARDWSTEGGDE